MKSIRGETHDDQVAARESLALALIGGRRRWPLAQNAIQSINSTQQAGSRGRAHRAERAAGRGAGRLPIQAPPRIAIDLPGVGNALGKSSVEINQGNLRSVNVAQAGERTRLVLNLKQAGQLPRAARRQGAADRRRSTATRRPALPSPQLRAAAPTTLRRRA